jgi:hypothetical protein
MPIQVHRHCRRSGRGQIKEPAVDAKQIKPYTFWIVCGVIVMIELGLIAFWPITNEAGESPEEVKSKLDQDFVKLKDLYDRAGREPKGVFDAENPDDIENLTKNYLLTPKWKGVLQPHVDKYNLQLTSIRKDLAARSAVLHAPIADSGDLFSWYTAYAGKTKEIMLSLRNAGALVVEAGNQEDSDFENGSRIRTQVGFFTKGERTPEAAQHPLLTTRFRIIEKLAQAIMAQGATAIPNPVVKTGREADLETKRPAQIKGMDWKQTGEADKALSGPIAEYASAYELLVTLEGTTSVLVATQAAIEHISEPVMIVTGGTLGARGNVAAGARKHTADEPMNLRLTIVVVDFSRIVNTASTEEVAGGTAK